MKTFFGVVNFEKMAYEKESPVYQNVSTRVKRQSKPCVDVKSAAKRKYENSAFIEHAGSDADAKKTTSNLRQINYTDIMVDNPAVSNENTRCKSIIEDDARELKAAKPVPPKKPVQSNNTERVTEFYSSFEDNDAEQAYVDANNNVCKPEHPQKSHSCGIVTCLLCAMVILAIIIGTSATSLAVLNFRNTHSCQTKSTSCFITSNQTCEANFSSNSVNALVRQMFQVIPYSVRL